ncbi:catechol 2,3-dioxygenase-like lactoylglutathione lyase family enzyme [Bradyrhizobium sp. JR3.5]
MLDHVTIGISDIERSKTFYDAALRPLGITRLYAEGAEFAGYGVRPKAFFWIGRRATPQTGAHIAFTANDRVTVDRFYDDAIKAGGRDNGRPGIRPHIMQTTTALSSSIPTVTISKPSATRRRTDGNR